MPVGRSPCLDRQVLWNLPCMWQLFELAHEYAAMGLLGPIQLIGRRRGEYPLVQYTVSRLAPLGRRLPTGVRNR